MNPYSCIVPAAIRAFACVAIIGSAAVACNDVPKSSERIETRSLLGSAPKADGDETKPLIYAAFSPSLLAQTGPRADAPTVVSCPNAVPYMVARSGQVTNRNTWVVGSGGTTATWKPATVSVSGGRSTLTCISEGKGNIVAPLALDFESNKAIDAKQTPGGFDVVYEKEGLECFGAAVWSAIGYSVTLGLDKTTNDALGRLQVGACEKVRHHNCEQPSAVALRSTVGAHPPDPWTVVGGDQPFSRLSVDQFVGNRIGNKLKLSVECNYSRSVSGLRIQRSVDATDYEIVGNLFRRKAPTVGTGTGNGPIFPDNEQPSACPSQLSIAVTTTYRNPVANETKFVSNRITGTLTTPSGVFKLGDYKAAGNNHGSGINFNRSIVTVGGGSPACQASPPYDSPQIQHHMEFNGDGCLVRGDHFQCSSRIARVDCPTLTTIASPGGANAAAWTSGPRVNVNGNMSITSSSGKTYMTCTYDSLIRSRGPTVVRK